jgi:hypothetical protein
MAQRQSVKRGGHADAGVVDKHGGATITLPRLACLSLISAAVVADGSSAQIHYPFGKGKCQAWDRRSVHENEARFVSRVCGHSTQDPNCRCYCVVRLPAWLMDVTGHAYVLWHEHRASALFDSLPSRLQFG